MDARTAELPCLTDQDITPTFPPGIAVRTLRDGTLTLRPVAPEERYPDAVAASGPDGGLEVVTVRSDGRLVLRKRTATGWTAELLPLGPPMHVTSFTIGPDGDRVIAGNTVGGVGLITDRGGTWRRSVVANGLYPQVNIDRRGRYHVGYLRRQGRTESLAVAVGRPGAWQRSHVPRSTLGMASYEVFMVKPDGSDVVAWRKEPDSDRKHGGLRLARSSADGWSVEKLSRDGFEMLWSAAMAPDGTIGLIRGGLSSSRFQEIRGGPGGPRSHFRRSRSSAARSRMGADSRPWIASPAVR